MGWQSIHAKWFHVWFERRCQVYHPVSPRVDWDHPIQSEDKINKGWKGTVVLLHKTSAAVSAVKGGTIWWGLHFMMWRRFAWIHLMKKPPCECGINLFCIYKGLLAFSCTCNILVHYCSELSPSIIVQNFHLGALLFRTFRTFKDKLN